MSEEYSGFDLTLYNLFTLLREMYYTRGETETNFLLKSGGTVAGSLTIQGNLVVNGQSYSIDTENLRVGDYTITLAKDNEQTLTSMVGMVVPKYDGTNYGFFGWDADGYAYVGDLTNYDGTSAITLANNSSLQRISTIDTTNTVVASNGVIYVYDATSHCFKKPTNDNKYYVIRNGAFVETELFTEQKSKNIDNALYNVGSFDTISGNTITRRTRYVVIKGDTFNWDSDNPYSNFYGIFYSNALPDIVEPADGYEIPKMSARGWNVYAREDIINHNQGITIQPSGNYLMIRDTSCSTKADLIAKLNANPIYIEYQSTTYNYIEDIIPNQPLLNLDSNGCNFLQEEWEKGLNLCDSAKLFVGYTDASGNLTSTSSSDTLNTDYIFLKAGTYTISSTLPRCQIAIYNTSKVYQSGYSWTTFTFTLTSDSYVRIGINDQSQTFTSSNTYLSATYKLMLNKGTHPYPYQEYNGAIVHQWDIEPVLLWENSSPSSQFNGVESMTIKDRTPYKYIKVFVSLGAGNSIFQIITLENASDGYSTQLMLGDGEKIWCREFKFLTSTTVKIGNGVSGSTTNNLRVVPKYIYGTNVL